MIWNVFFSIQVINMHSSYGFSDLPYKFKAQQYLSPSTLLLLELLLEFHFNFSRYTQEMSSFDFLFWF